MTLKRIKALLCCALLIALAIPVRATGNTNGKSSLVVNFPYKGTLFELYCVAKPNAGGTMVKTRDFQDCPVDISGTGNAYQASMLEGYVRLWGLEPMASNTVSSIGTTHFRELDGGVYLLLSRMITTHGANYIAQPLLITLPGKDAQNRPAYDVIVSPKPYQVPPVGSDEVPCTALKVWEDEDGEEMEEKDLPHRVTVYLLCDGELFDTQILNKEGNWRYTWEDLPGDHIWSVVEEPVEDFTVSIVKNGTTFVITNTKEEEPPPPPTTTPVKPPAILPQTGLLWWPVPVLAVAGLLLMILGWSVCRREDDEA